MSIYKVLIVLRLIVELFYIPDQKFDVSTCKNSKHIQFADPYFYRPDRLDLLLSVEFYYQLLSIGQIKLGGNLTNFQNTMLRWIGAGAIDGATSSNAMERFWSLDSIPRNTPPLAK